MPTEQRPLKVFLCHASQDKPVVRELSRRLIGEGWIDIWFDENKLLPGQDWRLSIEEAVETSDVVIICLSDNSVSKDGYVQKELRFAKEIALEKSDETIFLIPLRLDDCVVPRGLRFYQWVNYFGENKDEAYKTLIKSLKQRYEQKLRIEKAELARQEKERLEHNAAEKVKQEITNEPKPVEEKPGATKHQSVQRSPDRSRISTIIAIGGITVAIVISILNSLNKLTVLIPPSFHTSSPTKISTATITLTPVQDTPSHTVEPSPVLTETITPTSMPLPIEITDAKGVLMRLVPAGEFTMGSTAEVGYRFCVNMTTNIVNYGYICKLSNYQPEGPIHKVYLVDYFVDVFEVSNRDYKKCVSSGDCLPPSSKNANLSSNYYDNDYLLGYPVLNVTWEMARDYCEWRSARLPTEAEWEKAARGIDERDYPWGYSGNGYIFESVFYSNRANVNLNPGGSKSTVPVSSNSKGLSPYGLYNMAGNVAEWVHDWYSETYYLAPPYENPTGPVSGHYRVLRGGSVNDYDVRTTARDFLGPTNFNTGVGFRCAKDANP